MSFPDDRIDAGAPMRRWLFFLNYFLSFQNQLPGLPAAVNDETPKTKSVSVALEVQWSARQGGTAARRAQWQAEFFLFQFKK